MLTKPKSKFHWWFHRHKGKGWRTADKSLMCSSWRCPALLVKYIELIRRGGYQSDLPDLSQKTRSVPRSQTDRSPCSQWQSQRTGTGGLASGPMSRALASVAWFVGWLEGGGGESLFFFESLRRKLCMFSPDIS